MKPWLVELSQTRKSKNKLRLCTKLVHGFVLTSSSSSTPDCFKSFGPVKPMAAAPVGAVRRIDKTAMVKTCKKKLAHTLCCCFKLVEETDLLQFLGVQADKLDSDMCTLGVDSCAILRVDLQLKKFCAVLNFCSKIKRVKINLAPRKPVLPSWLLKLDAPYCQRSHSTSVAFVKVEVAIFYACKWA